MSPRQELFSFYTMYRVKCPEQDKYCPLPDLLKFHQTLMTSGKALNYALDQIEKLSYSIIAPQHGSVITGADTTKLVFEQLRALKDVGIEGVIRGKI